MSWLHEPALSVGALPGKQEDADPVTGQYALGFGFGLSLHDGLGNNQSGPASHISGI